MWDRASKRAAFGEVQVESPVRLQLSPATHVRLSFWIPECDVPPAHLVIEVRSPRVGRHPWTWFTNQAEFDTWLPAGEYEVHARGPGLLPISRSLSIASTESISIARVPFERDFLERHLGRFLPPWKVSEARGIPLEAASLKALQGRWVVVEFWSLH